VNQLREERARLFEEMRDLTRKAEAEARDLTVAEASRFDGLEVKAKELEAQELRVEKHARDDEMGLRRQINTDTVHRDGPSPLLGREQRLADHVYSSRQHGDFSPHERSDFSLGKLVRGMVTGSWDGADLERRALSEGTNSAGGFLTPEPLATYVIDRIRNQARVIEAGARTLAMDSDSFSIPRLVSGVTAGWRSENAAVAESDPVFERVTFTARSLAVMTRLSYELFQDMTPDGATVIENELVQALAIELDRVALRGTGTAPEPKGVKNQTGVATLTNGANGAAFTYTSLVNAVSTVQAAGFNPNATILAPRATKSLALIADTTGQPLQAPPYLSGHDLLVTNQIPINLTTGTSTDTSEAYTGQWDQLLIGFRPVVSISVQKVDGPAGMVGVKLSDQAYMSTMQVAILAFLRADIQVMHPEAFAVTTGLRP